MKLFAHSLTEDARDWFRKLPDDSISSWEELEKCFKEQYGVHSNGGFILNKFNNIKKIQNEFTFDFNVRFQKGIHKQFQVMRLEESVYLVCILSVSAFPRLLCFFQVHCNISRL